MKELTVMYYRGNKLRNLRLPLQDMKRISQKRMNTARDDQKDENAWNQIPRENIGSW